MKKTALSLILKIFILFNIVNAQTIPVDNFSFEEWETDSKPTNWEISGETQIRLDTKIVKNGDKSILIYNNYWTKSVILSKPVELIIGHLYKLSAWAKTESAVTHAIDRYPTSVAGCLTMESFPFTNHSPSLGSTRDWTQIEIVFIATKKTDKIRLHLGFNGEAKGKIWFDDVRLEKVEDIAQYISPETITWFDKGFRYDDRGWIFVHIEGKPYARGYQYGYLIAEEMVAYMEKLAIEVNENDPEQGWKDFRFIADAFMLRKYEKEFLTEMKGIADGANKAGVTLYGEELDLIDVVTMNSAIDIEWARYAMPRTGNALSGQSFLRSEDELNIPQRLHKCSSFLANKSSTTDGRIVFGQIFMWGGYTGPHWNVICDVDPANGYRLVYQTFPGGIHSGADFYINEKGIMIGETTVSQTPFNPEGSPQSNRIRKAAQYAGNIDEVVKILTTNNNGMYANDWLIGDTKTDEIAVLLLGTNKHKLWRSSNEEFYGDTNDFYWCNNNNKDPEVRKEYIPNADNAPYDLIFTPWNRDIAFNEFYRAQKGNIDAIAAVNVWASAPINRPHACDGKVTTSEMAENLVFLAHSGKVTLREKFIAENKRIPDLPGATPRLSLGYSVVSPVYISDKIKQLNDHTGDDSGIDIPDENIENIIDRYTYNSRDLWFNTVYPASEAENWFVSATAAYWKFLKNIPENEDEIPEYYQKYFADLNARYLYTTNREGTLPPLKAQRVYDRYNNYQVPRIKGTILLHQLRLLLGNETFSAVMTGVHEKYAANEMTTDDFIQMVNDISGKNLSSFVLQWLERDDLPNPEIKANVLEEGEKWQIKMNIDQGEKPYHFFTSVMIETKSKVWYSVVELNDRNQIVEFECEEKPVKLKFNILNDVLLQNDNYFSWSNFFDDFHHTMVVYGTKRQIEANHTLALRFSTTLADRYTEKLMPVIKDSEITLSGMENNDLIVLGNVADNSLMEIMVDKFNLDVNKNLFSWGGQIYHDANDGLFMAFPNPFNKEKSVYLFTANSAIELYQMTKDRIEMPSWAVYHGDEIIKDGFHLNEKYVLDLDNME